MPLCQLGRQLRQLSLQLPWRPLGLGPTHGESDRYNPIATACIHSHAFVHPVPSEDLPLG